MAKLMWVEWGSGWDQVVSVLAFNSDSPSSNHADAYSFSVNFAFEKTKNKQKSGSGCPFFLKNVCRSKVRYLLSQGSCSKVGGPVNDANGEGTDHLSGIFWHLLPIGHNEATENKGRNLQEGFEPIRS